MIACPLSEADCFVQPLDTCSMELSFREAKVPPMELSPQGAKVPVTV